MRDLFSLKIMFSRAGLLISPNSNLPFRPKQPGRPVFLLRLKHSLSCCKSFCKAPLQRFTENRVKTRKTGISSLAPPRDLAKSATGSISALIEKPEETCSLCPK